MNACYSDNRIVSDRTIDSHIRHLRRKMAEFAHANTEEAKKNTAIDRTAGQNDSDELIQSIYGVGYRLG